LHMAQQMPLPPTISCSSKSRLVVPSWFLPFWYLLTRVVPDKFQKSSKASQRVLTSDHRRNGSRTTASISGWLGRWLQQLGLLRDVMDRHACLPLSPTSVCLQCLPSTLHVVWLARPRAVFGFLLQRHVLLLFASPVVRLTLSIKSAAGISRTVTNTDRDQQGWQFGDPR